MTWVPAASARCLCATDEFCPAHGNALTPDLIIPPAQLEDDWSGRLLVDEWRERKASAIDTTCRPLDVEHWGPGEHTSTCGQGPHHDGPCRP